jgi:hypothetical protein
MKRNRSLLGTSLKSISCPTPSSFVKGALLALTLALNVSHSQALSYGLVVGAPLTNDYGHSDNFFINPVTGSVEVFAQTSAASRDISGESLSLEP